MARAHPLVVLAVLGVTGGAFGGACGGATLDDVLGGGAADAGGNTRPADAEAGEDALSRADAGQDAAIRVDAAPLDAGPDPSVCKELHAKVDALRPRAQECLPGVPFQCDAVVDDLCCPISVNKGSVGAPSVKDFVRAVTVFKQKGCVVACDSIACKEDPSLICDLQGLGGRCR